jgi:hypothetical protein
LSVSSGLLHPPYLISGMLGTLGFAFHAIQFFNSNFGDAVPFHFFDSETVAFVFERFAEIRDPLQARQDKACQGFEAGVPRQLETVLRFEITNVLGAFEHLNGIVSERRLRGSNVEFVLDIADELFENVFDSNYAGG